MPDMRNDELQAAIEATFKMAKEGGPFCSPVLIEHLSNLLIAQQQRTGCNIVTKQRQVQEFIDHLKRGGA